MAKLFDIAKYSGVYPEGQKLPISSVPNVLEFYAKRETAEEARARDREMTGLINSVREAAEVHRQVRRYAQSIIKPGRHTTDNTYFCVNVRSFEHYKDLVSDRLRPPFSAHLGPRHQAY